MTTIQRKGEKVRQAVKWISDARLEDEKTAIGSLIEKASGKFNLSPNEEKFLRSFYGQETG